MESWEWDVNPLNRQVKLSKKEVAEISEYLSGKQLVMHNAVFDIEALTSVGVELDLDAIDDTMGMAHTFNSLAPKGLKRAALLYAKIKDDDQKSLKKAVTQARNFGKKHKWDIARAAHPCFPHLKKLPKDVGWEVLDMWLPRAAWKHSDEIKEIHPEWETICARYANTDTRRTAIIDKFYREQLNKRGHWEQYIQNHKRLIKRVWEMKRRGTTLIPEQIDKIRQEYAEEANRRVRLYCDLLNEPVERHTDNDVRYVLHNKFHLPVLSWTAGGKGETRNIKNSKPAVTASKGGILPTYKALLERSWTEGLLERGVDLPAGYTLSDYYDEESDIPVAKHNELKRHIRDKVSLKEKIEIVSTEQWKEVTQAFNERGLNIYSSPSEKPQGNYIPYRVSSAISRGNIQNAWLYLRYLVGSRKYTKALDYLDSYANHADKDYRVHFNYFLSLTRTLRWSARDPNAQNIGNPTAVTEEGNPLEMWGVHTDLRSVFGPREGRMWICGDYSQLQLRLFATWSKERSLIESFERGYDAHTNIACKVYGIPLEESEERITKAMRTVGKGVNFGFIFGASPDKINITAGRPGLWEYVLEAFPSAHKMMDLTKSKVKAEGFVLTAGGYPLRVRETHKGVNYIIQGDEGEIVREAVDKCQEYLDHLNKTNKIFMRSPGFLTLQVHDELVFDLPENTPQEVIRMLKSIMEKAGLKFGFVTPIDLKIVRFGESWSEGEEYAA